MRKTGIHEGFELELEHEGKKREVEGRKACFDVAMTIEARADGTPDKFLFRIECAFEMLYELAPGFARNCRSR